MPRMEKADERRAERRLRYRWPVRFASDPSQKPLSAQMFDLSSKGMAMLFHANEDCPERDQSITANFGVPHFDAHGSFDTAFFNRVARVCRVDSLTPRVNRVAVKFAEPLFFRPGEQDVAEPEAQRRLQAKARSAVESADKATGAVDAMGREKEETRLQAEAVVEVREKLQAEIRAKEEARAEAQGQARLRELADNKALTEAERRAAAEAQALESARFYELEIAKVRAEAAREIARLEDEVSYKIAEAKAEVRAKLLAQAKARRKEEKQQKRVGRKSEKGGLVKKVEEFITDRNQVY